MKSILSLRRLSRSALALAAMLATSGAAEQKPASPSNAGGPSLPFSIELQEMPSTLPPLHSFCLGTSNGGWLVFGGRTAGLHGFADKNNFPRPGANTVMYVLDPVGLKVLASLDLSDLSLLGPELSNPLTSTNAQYRQDGDNLFVIGGYGQVMPGAEMVTFGTGIRIQVTKLVNMIISGEKRPEVLKTAFTLATDERFKVTGSGLKKIGNQFFLTFGHRFDGVYSINLRDYNNASGMQQVYTEKVRVFTLNADMTIADYAAVDGGYDPSLPYNRRDLNVVDTIRGDGQTPGITVYGGVFRAGQVAGQVSPIDIDAGATPANAKVTLVTKFQQGLSHYDCAEVTVFDPNSKVAFTTLFGGISQFHYDAAKNALIRDPLDLPHGIDGLPFINSISTIARGPNGNFSQWIQSITLPALLGTETRFILNSAAPSFPNGVLNLGQITGRTLVGQLYGGIEAGGPYSTAGNPAPGSKASSRVFQVWITPTSTPVTPLPPIPNP